MPSRATTEKDRDLGFRWYAKRRHCRGRQLQRNVHLVPLVRMMVGERLDFREIQTSYAPGLRASEGRLARSRTQRAGGEAGHCLVVLRGHSVGHRRWAPRPGAGRRRHVGRMVVERLSRAKGRSFAVGEGCRRRMVPRTLQRSESVSASGAGMRWALCFVGDAVLAACHVHAL